MTCVHFEGGKAERKCRVDIMDGSNEQGLLMAWTMDLQSLMMESEDCLSWRVRTVYHGE